MKQTTITHGTRQVVIMEQEGRFWARKYVNNGETATLESWKGTSMVNAEKWAKKVLEIQA